MATDVHTPTGGVTAEHGGIALSAPTDGFAGARPLVAHPVVEVLGAEARLNSRTLWSEVSLTVWPGEFMAVLGPNGVGKTTLLRVILGQLAVSAGKVRVLGKPAGQENHRIGYLPQRRSFDAGLRIRGIDLVRLGLDGDRWGMPLPGLRFVSARRRAEDAHVRDVIELVGASGYAERPVGEISGGEQQRLLIAQALVRDPALLLLDEPLNGLDLPSQAGITALIGEISQQRGIGVVMVAHDVNPLLGYLDQVAYVGDGRIVAGPPDDVITTETLSRLYGTTVEVVRTADGRLAVLGQPEVHATCHGSGC
jgi:zinc/manganese transport system ATP-binding protein